MPITVTHRDFSKYYFFDLVVADSAVYELKTATRLATDNENQALNYLFLWGAHHGKLLNFRPAQVETRFVNTKLTPEARKCFDLHLERWTETDSTTETFRKLLTNLLEDWGAFLDFNLYTEGVTHCLGGESDIIHSVPLSRNGIPLGNQRMHLLNADTAFKITGMTNGVAAFEKQLNSLLGLTPLKTLLWVNLNHHNIEFVTLTK
jgi:hypothetical protein